MIEEFTICLHCGANKEIVARQMELLAPLNHFFKVHWNNRIDRHPESYDSYSQMVNEAVVTSPTEYIILMNDRTVPKPREVLHILHLLQSGYAAATKYSVAFMGISKELFRTLGWWDQRFIGGGYEDDDFVLRLRMANLAYYESLEAEYDKSWKSPLRPDGGDACALSEPFFNRKWSQEDEQIVKVLPEEPYPEYDRLIGPRQPQIRNSWLDWSHSVIGVNFYVRDHDGPSRTYWFRTREGVEFRRVRELPSLAAARGR